MNQENIINLSGFTNSEEFTEFEADLIDIAKKYGVDGFNRVIWRKKNYKYTRVLSHIRHNCVQWIDMNKDARVLEIGSEYGSVTGAFAKKAKEVLSFDVSSNKTYINSLINKDYNNIKYVCGSFNKLKDYIGEKKFDYIYLIGSFDFANQFIDEDNCNEKLLNDIYGMLSENGKLIIAIDNKYGLKYLSGSVDSRYRIQSQGIVQESALNQCKRFSKKNIIELLDKCGYKGFDFYYPYPDYNFAMSIYSDEFLPSEDSFNSEKYSWEPNRTELFEEYKMFQEVTNDGLFSEFANSYLILAGKQEKTFYKDNKDDFNTVFVKYSNERAKTFAISTEIKENKLGERKVIKHKLSDACNFHMNKINNLKDKLKHQYTNTKFDLTPGKLIDNGFEFEYAKGRPYIDKLIECCNNNNYEEFIEIIQLFFDEVINANNDMSFSVTSQFKNVFGNIKLDNDLRCGLISNIDLIFQNVIVDSDNNWNIIDYEWLFDFPIPAKYILFRSIYYFFRGGNSGNLKFNLEWEQKCFEMAGIDDELYKKFFRMEVNYQKYVLGELVPIRNLPANNYHSIVGKSACIFIDSGDGFNSREKVFTEEKVLNNGRLEFEFNVPKEAKKIRIDPVERNCMIYVTQLKDENGQVVKYKTNGKKIKKNLFLFRNKDPQIIINDIDKFEQIKVVLEVMVFTPVINKKI